MGMAWGRRADSGIGDCCQRPYQRWPGKATWDVYRNNLPGTEGEHCLQREHDLVGGWVERAAGVRSAEGVYRATRARATRAADHHQPAATDDRWLSFKSCATHPPAFPA